MVIAGAGGHGKEIKYVLLSQGYNADELVFFDEDPKESTSLNENDSLIVSLDELKSELKKDTRFILGVGNPVFRERLFHLLISLGGSAYGVNFVSRENTSDTHEIFDSMPFSFLGSNTKIGKGVLINTRAHVHHDCEVGDFSEIGPGAMLLGSVKIGKKSRIGAGAVILPGVSIGENVSVGAGAVVTKYVEDGQIVKGIPAK